MKGIDDDEGEHWQRELAIREAIEFLAHSADTLGGWYADRVRMSQAVDAFRIKHQLSYSNVPFARAVKLITLEERPKRAEKYYEQFTRAWCHDDVFEADPDKHLESQRKHGFPIETIIRENRTYQTMKADGLIRESDCNRQKKSKKSSCGDSSPKSSPRSPKARKTRPN